MAVGCPRHADAQWRLFPHIAAIESPRQGQQRSDSVKNRAANEFVECARLAKREKVLRGTSAFRSRSAPQAGAGILLCASSDRFAIRRRFCAVRPQPIPPQRWAALVQLLSGRPVSMPQWVPKYLKQVEIAVGVERLQRKAHQFSEVVMQVGLLATRPIGSLKRANVVVSQRTPLCPSDQHTPAQSAHSSPRTASVLNCGPLPEPQR